MYPLGSVSPCPCFGDDVRDKELKQYRGEDELCYGDFGRLKALFVAVGRRPGHAEGIDTEFEFRPSNHLVHVPT